MNLRKLFFTLIVLYIFCNSSFAMLSLELTQGIAGAIPIAIVPFISDGAKLNQDISTIIAKDLKNSGRFKVIGSELNNLNQAKSLGADNVVIGKVQELGTDQYQVSFQLVDAFKGKATSEQEILLNKKYIVNSNELRAVAHHISDLIYQKITGIHGVFSTKLAYVVVQRSSNSITHYILEVADQDGYNPKPLLSSTDPIMSPAWSPNGKQIAYVSFEHQHAAIYLQDVLSGGRHLISEFPGINGAPAWSPDGRKLALVLSKSGAPNIYTLDISSRQLTQLTHDFYINTEPAWSPRGNSIVFTSNRSGNPQVYEFKLGSDTVSRITYDGTYNARPSFTPDGNHMVVLNRESGMYNIGVLDLDGGAFHVLTNSSNSDHGSPSIAPNGSMIVFESNDLGKNVLGMVTTDGNISLKLPARNGEVQDPAWSPFLS